MTTVAVTDTETTGLGISDQVCEVGIALLDVQEMVPLPGTEPIALGRGVKLRHTWSSLFKPTCSMAIAARATHHITDDELASAPTMTEFLLRRGFPEWGKPSEAFSALAMDSEESYCMVHGDVVLAAHNAPFDRQMLLQSGVHEFVLPARTICTYKCAMHLYPDIERYSNQHLRYALNLVPMFEVDGPPHRALPDVAVTAALVAHMLAEHSVEELVALSSQPILLKKVGFGTHRGKFWKDLDSGMLKWVLGKDFGENEHYTAQYWLDVRAGKRKHAD